MVSFPKLCQSVIAHWRTIVLVLILAPGAVISTIAGNGTCGFSGDGGPGTLAMNCNPEGLAVDANGSLYLGDYVNVRIRKVNRNGRINTIASSGNARYNGENLPAVSTNLDGPIAVSIDNVCSVFLLDDGQNRVRKIH